MTTGKQKRKVYFAKTTGEVRNGEAVWVPCPCEWNPGKSRNKYRR